MKPNGLTRAYTDSEPIRPMGPRGLDRAHPAVVAGVHVANFEAGALTDRPRGPAPTGGACGSDPTAGCSVHELASWLVPKNSLIAATTGRMRSGCGVIADVLRAALTHDALHAGQANVIWFWISCRRCADDGCRSGRCRRLHRNPTPSGRSSWPDPRADAPGTDAGGDVLGRQRRAGDRRIGVEAEFVDLSGQREPGRSASPGSPAGSAPTLVGGSPGRSLR